MSNSNVGLETSGMSWADMVEEDLEQQQQHPSNKSNSLDGGDSPINDDDVPPQRSWASLVAGRKQDNEPRKPPAPPPLTDNEPDSNSKDEPATHIQVSQWHAYAKTLQEEEAAEEAERRAKTDAAGPMPLPSDAYVKTSYDSSPQTDHAQGVGASRWAHRDDDQQAIVQKQVGEGLAASRWANAPSPRPRYGENNDRYGGSPDFTNGTRLNKFYNDRNRDDRYGNGNRRYDNSGSSWNSHADRTGSSHSEMNNWRAGESRNRNDGNSQRRYEGNEGYTQRRYDNNHRYNDGERTSSPWPRNQSLEEDMNDTLPTGGARESRWARSHETPAQSKWGPISPDSPSNGLGTQSSTNIESPKETTEPVTASNNNTPEQSKWRPLSPDSPSNGLGTQSSTTVEPPNDTSDTIEPVIHSDASLSTITTITTTFASMTTVQPSTDSVTNNDDSWEQNNSSTTDEPAADSWGSTGSTVNSNTAAEPGMSWESGTENAAEAAPSWGANQVEQAPTEPALRITSWKDVIGPPLDNDIEPGLANQAWKVAAAAAPPRTRRTSITAPSATYSQGTHGSNIPHPVGDHSSSQTPSSSWSADNTKTEGLPAPSWTTDNTKTEDLPAPSWTTVDNTPQDSSFTYSHDKAQLPHVNDQPPSTNDEANPWKVFASKEIERHPRLPQNLHTRPLPRTGQQPSSGYHHATESSHHAATKDLASSQSPNIIQPQDDSWKELQGKMANSWST